MQIAELYHRFVYRDILAYALPGAIFSYSMFHFVLPLEFNGSRIETVPITAVSLIVFLGVGFMVGHLVSVIPRNTVRDIVRSIALRRYSSRLPDSFLFSYARDFFDKIFGVGTWDEKSNKARFHLIRKWVHAQDADLEEIERAESIAIFLENAVVMLPVSIVLWIIKANLTNIDLFVQCFIIMSAIIVFTTGCFATYDVRRLVIDLYFEKFLEIAFQRTSPNKD